MSKNEAHAIYEANYWQAILGDKLPSGVDCSVMDLCVNGGQDRATRMLQQIVGSHQDGGMGPNTLQAVEAYVEAHGAEKLIEEYAAHREAFYRGLHTFDEYS